MTSDRDMAMVDEVIEELETLLAKLRVRKQQQEADRDRG